MERREVRDLAELQVDPLGQGGAVASLDALRHLTRGEGQVHRA